MLTVLASLLLCGEASAFCRANTCRVASDFTPVDGACAPPGWEEACARDKKKALPLWWRSGCIDYSLDAAGGAHVSYVAAQRAAREAFAAWTTHMCEGTSRTSIDVHTTGPLFGAVVEYSSMLPNRNVIVFRDAGWPHKSAAQIEGGGRSQELALTTLTYLPETGELLDADIEINSSDYNIVPVVEKAGLDVYDLQVVLTHEAGHFLGLAHSHSPGSVMFSRGEGEDVAKRRISEDDALGICAAYPPDGRRAVGIASSQGARAIIKGCEPPARGPSAASASPTKPPNLICAQGIGRAAPGLPGLFLCLAGLLLLRRRWRCPEGCILPPRCPLLPPHSNASGVVSPSRFCSVSRPARGPRGRLSERRISSPTLVSR